MSSLPAKTQLKNALLEILESDLAALERAQSDTQSGATHAEAKQESDKDTRAIEQQYLARGQSSRVEELRNAVNDMRRLNVADAPDDAPVSLGSLVTIEEEGQEYVLFMAPHCGGAHLADGAIQVVTPKSPLGSAILGAHEGDDCNVHAQRDREVSIMSVR